MVGFGRFASMACFVLLFAASDADAQRTLPPEVVSLQTRDGVQLKATYYPSNEQKGSPRSKQVTPVVLLHDYKDTRAVFASLAQRLQGGEGDRDRPPFAAVTVD